MTDEERFNEAVDGRVRQYFFGKEPPTEKEIRERYELSYDFEYAWSPVEGIDREKTVDHMVERYCIDLSVRKPLGNSFQDDKTKPWLRDLEESPEWFYWSRYKRYLIETVRWAPDSVWSVDRDTEAILDLMADPKADHPFERKGLVVADVQSGKTANYIGLITRAADVGYKIIIVMAGVHNVLRSQTQERIEEGFGGKDIDQLDAVAGSRRVGVGISSHGGGREPIVCTSRDKDFSTERANALSGISTRQTTVPLLFVIKKNSKVLKKVYDWLVCNADKDDPLLLIDDEADNASINGQFKKGQRKDEPSRINGQIRMILNYFNKRCYVGYTATPYANILISPSDYTDEYGRDLFPSSFIYTLQDATNYFGADKVFADYDSNNPRYLRFIDDIDDVLPPKHKSDFEVVDIPTSLERAIRTFIIATAIRILRGDAKEHTTMMVNVSPYMAPQKTVARRIDDYLRELSYSIKSYSALPADIAPKVDGNMASLLSTWEAEYKRDTEFEWKQVQPALYDAVKDAHVAIINSSSSEVLDYDNGTQHVIAVGGYRLSRGLTLKGLVVSYYSRNAKAYDALMQMARWFGYRPGYEDLCRVWMSEQSAGWYSYVADCTSDLFDEFRDMRHYNMSPRDYGLKIRQSPDSLIVTARNKMGTGTTHVERSDLNNGFVETVAFDRRPEVIAGNRETAAELVTQLAQHQHPEFSETNLLYTNVPVEYVTRFINAYRNDDTFSIKSQKQAVLGYIQGRTDDGECLKWDVYIAQGEDANDGEAKIDMGGGVMASQEVRSPGKRTDAKSLIVGERYRLSSRGVEKYGLTQAEKDLAKEDFYRDHEKGRSPSDRYYRRRRERPLLILHPVLMKYTGATRRRREKEDHVNKPPAGEWKSWDHAEGAIGWSISFPYTYRQTEAVEYIFNQVALDNIASDYEEDSDDNREDDDE